MLQKFLNGVILMSLLALCLGGCSGRVSRHMTTELVTHGGFGEHYFDTSSFVVYGLLRPASLTRSASAEGFAGAQGVAHGAKDSPSVLHVYVEGDGLAWESSRRPSRDPTPDTPVVLRLASTDPSSGPVLYLARPCQYVRGEAARLCRPEYWTAGRLSEQVINSLNEAVDIAKARSGARQVVLVGYSGGGGAVALMAARRQDVVFLGTVAGVLDHAAWTAHHKVSPLRSSLNALDVAKALRSLPQRHMTGDADSIVPAQVNAAFCRAVGAGEGTILGTTTGMAQRMDTSAQCVRVPGVRHDGPWERVWSYGY